MSKKLLLLIFLAAVVRLINLGNLPNGFNADEAALGYNAWSLALTGKDEHANPMPVNLVSFGDYKPALYTYFAVPLVSIFGLSELVVRLPSALMGILAVATIYALVQQLFSGPTISGRYKHAALAAAGYLAISPWHIHFSRGAWEVNCATTLLLLGLYGFIRFIRTSHTKYIFVFCVSFLLSMYCYQSARLIAPLLGGFCIVFHNRTLLTHSKKFVFALLPVIVMAIPLAISVLTSDAASRLNGVGLLADEGPLNRIKEFRGQYSGRLEPLSKVLHNRPVMYSLQFVKNYLSHFDGNFLFVNGDLIDRNRVPESGLLYSIDSVFIILGLVALSRYKSSRKTLIIGWVLIAPVAAAATFQVPHALRAQNMIIPIAIIAGLGISFLCNLLQTKGRGVLLMALCVLMLVYSWQFARYWHEYSVHYVYDLPASWQYGFKNVANYISQNENKYSRIIVTNKYDQPYILLLFYLQYPPKMFQDHHELTLRDRYNFSTVNSFDKYVFQDTNWDKVRNEHGALIIAASQDIPQVGANVIDTLYFPNNHPEFTIVAN